MPPGKGERVNTREGEGTVVDYRRSDDMYVVELDWVMGGKRVRSVLPGNCVQRYEEKAPLPNLSSGMHLDVEMGGVKKYGNQSEFGSPGSCDSSRGDNSGWGVATRYETNNIQQQQHHDQSYYQLSQDVLGGKRSSCMEEEARGSKRRGLGVTEW